MENVDFPQTEQQWAFKQIYKKGSNRIDTDTPALDFDSSMLEIIEKLFGK